MTKPATVALTALQRAFLERALYAPAGSVNLLSAPAGTGRTSTTFALAGQLVAMTGAPVLLIAHQRTVEQYAERNKNAGDQATILPSRRAWLEYTVQAPAVLTDGFPGGLVVLPIVLLRNAEIEQVLLSTAWHTIIADDLSPAGSHFLEVLRDMRQRHPDMCLVMAQGGASLSKETYTLADTLAQDGFSPISLTRWTVSNDSKVADVRSVPFMPHPTELEFRRRVQKDLVQPLDQLGWNEEAMALQRRLHSSVYATEAVLRRLWPLRNYVAHSGTAPNVTSDHVRSAISESPTTDRRVPSRAVHVSELFQYVLSPVRELIALLDEVAEDAKLAALLRLLHTPPSLPMIVLTDFRETQEYLQSALGTNSSETEPDLPAILVQTVDTETADVPSEGKRIVLYEAALLSRTVNVGGDAKWFVLVDQASTERFRRVMPSYELVESVEVISSGSSGQAAPHPGR
ncbi:hypothetical protein [Deinococcus peraridilitoris]|uniref:Uncharacterized protein n=1 Tax=Deinococcus peraridilitoris (strain DSM 19664 / LMG 22246 / CIP 109416 / KR-200) TaxID=937777 RepID=L0A0Q4_DEIPD|nr:hypothetical protein [Deinococcus peraridilitoris]AFZ67426.1 hypothetical protein Deipe_1922 [Deinococcus peraridilitoris DSM 19664]